jgi:hypothetical protein
MKCGARPTSTVRPACGLAVLAPGRLDRALASVLVPPDRPEWLPWLSPLAGPDAGR